MNDDVHKVFKYICLSYQGGYWELLISKIWHTFKKWTSNTHKYQKKFQKNFPKKNLKP